MNRYISGVTFLKNASYNRVNRCTSKVTFLKNCLLYTQSPYMHFLSCFPKEWFDITVQTSKSVITKLQ